MSTNFSVFTKLPRGCGLAQSAAGPSAAFLSEKEIRESTGLAFDRENKDGKFFLGVIDAEIKTATPQESRGRARRYAEPVARGGGKLIGVLDDRHIVTVAGSRAGKARASIIPNLLTYPGSMVVIDPKGDLARDTAERRRRMGQKVHVLDPFNASGLSGEPLDTYNPLRELKDSPTPVEDAGLIADAIVMKNKDAKDPHWDESASRLIETLVLHVATARNLEGCRDLVTVWQFLCNADKKGYRQDLESNASAAGAVQTGAGDFYQRPDNERSSVLSNARRHARFLGYSSVQSVLKEAGSLNLADLKTMRMTVYLILPAMRMGTCSRWLRLFVNMALARMESVKAAEGSPPVIFCLDEFAVLGHMKTIEDAAGQLAGLGVKLWPILQDLTQLQALYGDRWETFLGNAGVLQFFGNSDQTTLEWISKRLGETVVKHKSQSDLSHAGAVRGESGVSFSESVHPLMTPEEISRFFGRDDWLLRQIVIIPSLPPMVLQRAYYDKEFAELLNP